MRRVSDFQVFPQLTAQWCWAAASQMMQRRYLGNEVEQCQIASNAVGQGIDCCARPTPRACLIQGPLYLPGLAFESTGEDRYMSWENIREEIDGNRPFLISSYSHYYACIGYDDGGGSRAMLLWDPMPVGRGHERTMALSEYIGLDGSQSYYRFRRR